MENEAKVMILKCNDTISDIRERFRKKNKVTDRIILPTIFFIFIYYYFIME